MHLQSIATFTCLYCMHVGQEGLQLLLPSDVMPKKYHECQLNAMRPASMSIRCRCSSCVLNAGEFEVLFFSKAPGMAL